MKIEKISYQKTYSIGPYLTDRVGFEATLSSGQNEFDALSELEQTADEWHREAHPHLYQETSAVSVQHVSYVPPAIKITTSTNDISTVIDYKQIENLEIAIDNASTPEELDEIKKANPLFPAKLLDTFNKKRKELSK